MISTQQFIDSVGMHLTPAIFHGETSNVVSLTTILIHSYQSINQSIFISGTEPIALRYLDLTLTRPTRVESMQSWQFTTAESDTGKTGRIYGFAVVLYVTHK